MTRPDKVATVGEVRDSLATSAATLLTHYRGLGVKDLKRLRTALREVDAELRVVKNTLARRAASEAGIEGLDGLLEGPTGLVFCREDPVGPAKALRAFAKDHPDLVVRGGYLDGEVLDGATAAALADLASREELLARLAGLLIALPSRMARLLTEPLAQQARLIQALIDKGGASEGAEPATAAAPAPAPVDAEVADADDVPAEATAEAATSTEDAPTDAGPADEAPADAAPEASDD